MAFLTAVAAYLQHGHALNSNSRAPANPKLTERDAALLRYLLEGLTNREIGINFSVSEGAVKASLRLLFEKVNVRSRTQLVKVALEQYQDQL